MTTPSHLLTPATTAPAPNLPAADVPATEAPAAKQLAASLLQEPKQVVGSAHSAAFQVLQSLSLQHSSRLQRIYNSSNLQQLLQPCLDVLHQQQRAGNDAICKASMAQVKARQAMSKAEGSALLGSSKAHDMPQQQWSLIRYAELAGMHPLHQPRAQVPPATHAALQCITCIIACTCNCAAKRHW